MQLLFLVVLFIINHDSKSACEEIREERASCKQRHFEELMKPICINYFATRLECLENFFSKSSPQAPSAKRDEGNKISDLMFVEKRHNGFTRKDL